MAAWYRGRFGKVGVADGGDGTVSDPAGLVIGRGGASQDGGEFPLDQGGRLFTPAGLGRLLPTFAQGLE